MKYPLQILFSVYQKAYLMYPYCVYYGFGNLTVLSFHMGFLTNSAAGIVNRLFAYGSLSSTLLIYVKWKWHSHFLIWISNLLFICVKRWGMFLSHVPYSKAKRDKSFGNLSWQVLRVASLKMNYYFNMLNTSLTIQTRLEANA